MIEARAQKVALPQIVEEVRRRLEERARRELSLNGFAAAAVAVPLVKSPAGLSVLLTVRTAHVEQHKGEISFPGGRVDPADADSRAAALRETREEVGIHAADLRVLGTLDDFVSVTGYRVTPHVVWLPREEYPFRPEPREVAEILLIPLDHLLDPAHHRLEEWAEGDGRRLHFYQWGPYVVWGLTAAILQHFLETCVRGPT